MTCEFNGVKYRAGDVVCDTIEHLRKIPCDIKERIDKCTRCGKAVKLSARNGRDGLCLDCFKLVCPQLHGYMATNQTTGTACKFCGQIINNQELISEKGECEACYYKNLGIEKAKTIKFGGEDGSIQ